MKVYLDLISNYLVLVFINSKRKLYDSYSIKKAMLELISFMLFFNNKLPLKEEFIKLKTPWKACEGP